MKLSLAEFNRLVDTEAYFEFFKLPYAPQIVQVNRLHILQQFARNIKEIDASFPEVNEEEKLSKYRVALEQAYAVFLNSTAIEQKLFKVFHEKPKNIVLLKEISS